MEEEDGVLGIQAALDIHWEEKTHLQAARYKFFTMKGQSSDESISDFVARIQKQAPLCEFNKIPQGSVEDKMSTLALIIGIGENETRLRLLTEDAATLTFKRACELAQIRADLQKTVDQFKHPDQGVNKIQKRWGNQKPQKQGESSNKVQQSRKCRFCGFEFKQGHQERCPAKTRNCNNCGKKGHFSSVCKKQRR